MKGKTGRSLIESGAIGTVRLVQADMGGQHHTQSRQSMIALSSLRWMACDSRRRC
jgi:hypothetical protein